jgi:hypothetical protein
VDPLSGYEWIVWAAGPSKAEKLPPDRKST